MSRHRAPVLAKRLLAGGMALAVGTIAAATVIAVSTPVHEGHLARQQVSIVDAAQTTPATPVKYTTNEQAATVYGWGAPVATEQFNGASVDKTRWSVYNGPGHHNQGKRSPSAVSVSGGALTIKGDAAGTTGGMSAKFGERKYGRWEVRMRTAARKPGYHPVLILWPQDGYLRGKCDGEVDFSESTHNTTLTHFYLHHGCANTQTTVAIKNDTTVWHNYAVEWTPKGIVGYIDGREWFRDTNTAHLPPRPMHLTIQLDWFPADGPALPTSLSVDWVKVYNVSAATAAPKSTVPASPAVPAAPKATPVPVSAVTPLGGSTPVPFVTPTAAPAPSSAPVSASPVVTATQAPTTPAATRTATPAPSPTQAPAPTPAPTQPPTPTPTASPTPSPSGTGDGDHHHHRSWCERHPDECDDHDGNLLTVPLPGLPLP